MTETHVTEAGATPELSTFHRFFDKLYPAIRFWHERVNGNAWFTEIMPELWLGGAPHTSADYAHIVDSGITAVLDVRAEREDDTGFYALHDISYLRLHVPDVTVPDAASIECGVNWIHDQVQSGRVVLVHCAKGRGRSATLVAAYLMRERGLGFDEAKELLDHKRPLTKLEPKHRREIASWQAAAGGQGDAAPSRTR